MPTKETPSSVVLTKATSHILKLVIFVIYHSCFLCLFLKPRSVVEGGETHRCLWRAVKVWLEFQTLSRLVYTNVLGKSRGRNLYPECTPCWISEPLIPALTVFVLRFSSGVTITTVYLKKHGHKFLLSQYFPFICLIKLYLRPSVIAETVNMTPAGPLSVCLNACYCRDLPAQVHSNKTLIHHKHVLDDE